MNSEKRLKLVRIAGLTFLGALIMFGFAIARPATESMFLAAHTSKALPIVWFFVAASVLAAVVVYNRFVARHDLIDLLGRSSAISAAALALIVFLHQSGMPGSEYALYIWKDVYIVVVVEIYYSYANSVFPIHTARWVYGLFGAFGASGGIAGNLLVGKLAGLYGTAPALWLVIPTLLLIWLFCLPFKKAAGIGTPLAKAYSHGDVRETIRVVRKSSYLALLLLLIAVVQIVITLVDYQYNGVLERAYPAMDYRTGIIGKVYAATDVASFVLYLLTGPILRLAGVPLVILSIPCVLATGLTGFLLFPKFLVMAGVKVASKSFDYTLFKISKEILYIPLTYAEKTMGKSAIDMFVYRIGKGGASLILMGLVALSAANLAWALAFVLIAVWVVIAAMVVKRFRRKVSREREMTSA